MNTPADKDIPVPDWPDPPQTRALTMSATLFVGLGILHLILSQVEECLRALNFWLGLFEVVVALLLFWFIARRGRRRPPPRGGVEPDRPAAST